MPSDLLKNKEFHLVCIIYNASQAAKTCNQYLKDVEGNQEVERFFNDVVETNADLMQKVRTC